MIAKTLFDKLWDAHVVADLGEDVALLHVDRVLLHDLSGRSALEDLERRGLAARNPELACAVPDHLVSTEPGRRGGNAVWSDKHIAALRSLSAKFGIRHIDVNAPEQGIVHVIGPELGLTLPGTTVVCGDSHTCTHGALGALAFGIGSTEVDRKSVV